jgi:NACHT domain
MDVDEALTFVEERLVEHRKRLNDFERELFRAVWDGQSYKEIHQAFPGRSQEHIARNIAPNLWKLLSSVLEVKVSKFSLRGSVENAKRQLLDRLEASERQLLLRSELTLATDDQTQRDEKSFNDSINRKIDWGDAPDASPFYGREHDLDELGQWLTLDCRLVVLYGMPGTGKTALSVNLMKRVKEQFDFVIWRSLHHWQALNRPPLLAELLADLIQFLSNQQDLSNDLASLRHYLVHHRCLIVLDGLESVLCQSSHDGSYRADYSSYGEFLEQVGETASIQQSCLLITSRELPKDIADQPATRIRAWELHGLGEETGRDFLMGKGHFSDIEGDLRALVRLYAGNPRLLNQVVGTLRHVFSNSIPAFLEQVKQDMPWGLDDLFHRPFECLSTEEQTVIAVIWRLTNNGESATFAEIMRFVASSMVKAQLAEVLISLRRRSLIKVSSRHYMLQPLVMAYMTGKSAESGH